MVDKIMVKEFEAERPGIIIEELNSLARKGWELTKILVLPPILSKIGLPSGAYRILHYFKETGNTTIQYAIFECVPETFQTINDCLQAALEGGWNLFDVALIPANPYPKVYHYFTK